MDNIKATDLIVFIFIFLLIIFTALNLYMTINYYSKLRNDVGKQGHAGLKGEDGSSGDSGVCVFTEKCRIKNCEAKIYDEIEKRNYYGTEFTTDCLKDPNSCETEDLKEASSGISELIKIQIDKCNNSKKDEKTLLNELFPQLE